MDSIVEFFYRLEDGDKAGWLQAIGTVLAILASGWIAVWQAKKQYKNSLRLQDIQDKNKEIILTESVVEIIKNSATRAKYVYDSLSTRQDVYDGGCTEFCVNGLMTGNRRTSRIGYDLKHKENSTQRPH